MGRNEASDSIPRTDRERGRLQFIAGIALLLYGGAMLFDLAPTPSWYVYLVVGVGLFAWGISQGVRELRWDRSLLFEWPPTSHRSASARTRTE